MEQKNFDQIELRSEKVRNIIGVIPPSLVRFGISIIAFIFVLLAIAAYYIPYPENIEGQAVAIISNHKNHVRVLVPYKYLSEITLGMDIQIEFDGYPSKKYGTIKSQIAIIDNKVITIDNDNYFVANILLPSHTQYEIRNGMKGKVSILISNETLLDKIF
mgnify:CR=1 FL=1